MGMGAFNLALDFLGWILSLTRGASRPHALPNAG